MAHAVHGGSEKNTKPAELVILDELCALRRGDSLLVHAARFGLPTQTRVGVVKDINRLRAAATPHITIFRANSRLLWRWHLIPLGRLLPPEQPSSTRVLPPSHEGGTSWPTN